MDSRNGWVKLGDCFVVASLLVPASADAPKKLYMSGTMSLTGLLR